MYKHRLLLFIATFVLAFPAWAGPDSTNRVEVGLSKGSPEWLIKMYFIEPSFPEVDRYDSKDFHLMREEMGDTWGALRPVGSTIIYRRLPSDSSHAYFAVTSTDSTGTIDIYCYLVKDDNGWKFEAVRSLAMTQYAYTAIQVHSEKESPTPDDDEELAELKLEVASDSSLRAHLIANQGVFDTLASIAWGDSSLDINSNDCPKLDASSQNSTTNTICAGMKTIHVRHISRYYDHKTWIWLLVGGMLDDRVGYLFVPEGIEPPAMSPHEFILVDKISPHWYLIKTT